MSLTFKKIPIAFCIAALAVACGSDEAAEDSAVIESALGQDFGGLTAEDEEPMFGEESTFADLDEAAEDPAEAAPSTDTTATDASTQIDTAVTEAEDIGVTDETARRKVYAIAVSWGRRLADSTADAVTVWDPTISTDCGVLGVRRLIAMETASGEGVVRPRSSLTSVSFTSKTKPSFDGAVILLALPRAGCAAGDLLHFDSAAASGAAGVSITVPINDTLANLVLREPQADGTTVAAFAHKLEPRRNNDCVRGNLVGRCVQAVDSDGTVSPELGRFYGRVIGQFGDLKGHIKGLYGVPKRGRLSGKKVFFGKYINRDGVFAGLLAGRFRQIDMVGIPENPTPLAGAFGGGWHLRPEYGRGALRGLLGGHYIMGTEQVPDGGFMRGRYVSLGCRGQIDEAPIE